MAISKEIREWVRERAQYLCEYCHSLEEAFINQRSPPPCNQSADGEMGGASQAEALPGIERLEALPS